MSINIAVCDDTKIFADQIKDIVDDIFLDKYAEENYNCDIYHSSEELLTQLIQSTEYNIYLLDIEMPVFSGIEVAKRIRKRNENAIIIFVTFHLEFKDEAFDVTAFHYIPKPLDTAYTKAIVEKAIARILPDKEKPTITFEFRKGIFKLSLDDIRYIEGFGRKKTLYVDSKTYVMNSTVKDLLKKLDSRFAQVNRSHIVNMDFIKKLEDTEVILFTDEKLQLTGNFNESFKMSYLKYRRKVFLC